jgi:hypothetical protein
MKTNSQVCFSYGALMKSNEYLIKTKGHRIKCIMLQKQLTQFATFLLTPSANTLGPPTNSQANLGRQFLGPVQLSKPLCIHWLTE